MNYSNTQLGGMNMYDDSTKDLFGNVGFMEYLGEKGVDMSNLTPEQLQGFNTDFEASKGLGNWGMGGYGGAALGAGQLGLGLASFMDTRKTAGKQRELMDQQLQSNQYLMDKKRADAASLSRAFGA